MRPLRTTASGLLVTLLLLMVGACARLTPAAGGDGGTGADLARDGHVVGPDLGDGTKADGPNELDSGTLDAHVVDSGVVDTSPGLDHGGVDLPRAADLPTGPPTATAQHDDCQTPLLIDLASMGVSGMIFDIDTTGASADFAIGTCSPFPDVVVAIRHAPASRALSCISGNGGLTYAATDFPACTTAPSTFFQINCLGGTVAVPSPATDYVLVFCRDPLLGPARIRIAP